MADANALPRSTSDLSMPMSYDSTVEDAQRRMPKGAELDTLLAAHEASKARAEKEMAPDTKPSDAEGSPGPSASVAPKEPAKKGTKRAKSPGYWKLLCCKKWCIGLRSSLALCDC